ncbi:alpha/beta hydrolase fold domain-containing protein [Burkholderia gladioli]|uniref:alpha/beta hydrolase fold domain-containing protein n=1 Tax=Burkholderia gladioli TaxID=28095 RepID=UPI001C274E48|nr:alpha/beta hydrolase fold domain-containing protein [Burkholderia gladioli]MBU9384175.1 alpha/beta hydrolase [Burkholderia gladioli]
MRGHGAAALLSHRRQFKGSMRELYDALSAQTLIAAGVDTERVDGPEVHGWWVRPPACPADRAVVFLHGGCYLLGSAEAYRGLASQLAASAGMAAFVPDYPLASEHPFPAASVAAARVLDWLAERSVARLALAGDSAGGAPALGMLHAPRARERVASVVVFSPWVDLAFEGASFHGPATHDPVFQKPMPTQAVSAYLGGADPRHPLASPLYGLPEWLPPLAIQVGTTNSCSTTPPAWPGPRPRGAARYLRGRAPCVPARARCGAPGSNGDIARRPRPPAA